MQQESCWICRQWGQGGIEGENVEWRGEGSGWELGDNGMSTGGWGWRAELYTLQETKAGRRENGLSFVYVASNTRQAGASGMI